jgi:hypothetical protein
LSEHLECDLYSECFKDDLAEILEDNLPEDQADSAQTLADKWSAPLGVHSTISGNLTVER